MEIIACLKIYVHETTNTVFEGSPVIFFNFYSHPIRGVAMKSSFSNDMSTGKGDFWNFTSSSPPPNIILWFCWWYDMYGQYWWHVHFGLCWYREALVLYTLGRYSQIEYQIIWSVFQIKSYSVLLWVYHLF